MVLRAVLRQPMTTLEIAGLLDVSERTVRRLMAALVSVGLPLEQAQAMPGQQGRWSPTPESVAAWFGLEKKRR